MSFTAAFLGPSLPANRSGALSRAAVAAIALLHLAALTILVWTEGDIVGGLSFLLAWGAINFIWLALLRRPSVAAGLSLILVVVLILLSRFKLDVLIMTANVVDVMLIDADTTRFLFKVFPRLSWIVVAAATPVLPLLVALWWFDPYRVRRLAAAAGAITCLVALSALSLAVPMDREKAFEAANYVSQFVRSAALAMVDLTTHGMMASDARAPGGLPPVASASCKPAQKPPHIIMVLDESSFDISAVPGVAVGPNYQQHFRSFDGQLRHLLIEGAGGPTWYTEYNVLAGLSARSFGRFSEFVTRIAAGHVTRGLPQALDHCGYQTFSLYPWLGYFLNARGFQSSLGIRNFLDIKNLGIKDVEPDSFYYNYTADLVRREKQNGPMFVLTYLMANHFPWTYRFRPDLLPGWRDPGNGDVGGHSIDEYLRRQEMSARDYKAFVARLRHDFPGEPFLIVRFGDHQPLFAKQIIDRKMSNTEIGNRIDAGDQRFFTTYYAIDALNFTPADLSTAIDGLDAPYLPLVVMKAAGLPLDAPTAEQQRIFERCNGLFFRCGNGAEASRFNRLLIDAGLIKGL